jgi:hypothetical protein
MGHMTHHHLWATWACRIYACRWYTHNVCPQQLGGVLAFGCALCIAHRMASSLRRRRGVQRPTHIQPSLFHMHFRIAKPHEILWSFLLPTYSQTSSRNGVYHPSEYREASSYTSDHVKTTSVSKCDNIRTNMWACDLRYSTTKSRLHKSHKFYSYTARSKLHIQEQKCIPKFFLN